MKMVELDDATWEVVDRIEMKVECMKSEMESFLKNLTLTMTPEMEEGITDMFEDDPMWVNTGDIWGSLVSNEKEMYYGCLTSAPMGHIEGFS